MGFDNIDSTINEDVSDDKTQAQSTTPYGSATATQDLYRPDGLPRACHTKVHIFKISGDFTVKTCYKTEC